MHVRNARSRSKPNGVCSRFCRHYLFIRIVKFGIMTSLSTVLIFFFRGHDTIWILDLFFLLNQRFQSAYKLTWSHKNVSPLKRRR